MKETYWGIYDSEYKKINVDHLYKKRFNAHSVCEGCKTITTQKNRYKVVKVTLTCEVMR